VKPRLLDLFCGAGGAAMGYHRAGFEVGNGAKRDYYNRRGGYQGSIAEKREAMDIDWMTASEINQAIPPAYTEHIGGYLMAAVRARQEAVA
jgi:site-specific DNA-cytosine methylase